MKEDTTNRIEVKEGKRGKEVNAYNRERNETLNIGTISGSVYEKGNVSIFWALRTINLPIAELEAVEQAGAMFLRCIPRGKGETYSISLPDFRANATPYHNAYYGDQLACPLAAFQTIATAAKRNTRTDNPKQSQPGEIIRQLPMFGGGR